MNRDTLRLSRLAAMKGMLVCPDHRDVLQFDAAYDRAHGVPWPDGDMKCPKGCRWTIQRGIPRFVPRKNYALAFGYQWQRYRRSQLDSYTGHSYSQQRLERGLGMSLDELTGKAVLECGAGAGRFTELLIQKCGVLVSLDLSEAVDANLANCQAQDPYLLLQADINASPLPFSFFDIVICLGVLQHTPSPEQTIASLAAHLKPGGMLVIDHYYAKSSLGRYLTLAYPLRAVLKRLRPEFALKITIALTAICNPVRKLTSRSYWLDRIASRVFPSACYYRAFPELDPNIVYEWNELDTFDMLTDYYKHFRSPKDIQGLLQSLGFTDIRCTLAGNGVEARARLPKFEVGYQKT